MERRVGLLFERVGITYVHRSLLHNSLDLLFLHAHTYLLYSDIYIFIFIYCFIIFINNIIYK